MKRLSRSNVFVHQFKATTAIGNQLAGPLKGSQSSSDVYALNSSEGGLGDFYGVVRPKQDKAKRRQPAKKPHSGSSSGASSQTPSPKLAASNNGGPGHLVQADKVVRLFSMAKFKQALEFESRKSVPNRARLLNMCISVVSFVMDDQKMLNLPSWVMVINIVAMDLMASEIGLVEPYADLLPEPALSTANHWGAIGKQQQRLRANRSFGCLEDHDYENDEEEEEDGEEGFQASDELATYRDFNGFPDSFTNDASGGHKETNSDGELTNQMKSANNHLDLNDGPTNAVEQLGSSSSGFISSHQNDDSSANSSSSNIANSDRPHTKGVTERDSALALKPSRFRQKLLTNKDKVPSRNDLGADEQQQQKQVPKASQARGKRPPKLPHGMSESKLDQDSLSSENEPSSPVIMSDPIPIPAPPTSAGGPSGKANLILVSPTGLSPPTPKKLHSSELQANKKQRNAYASGMFQSETAGKPNSDSKRDRSPPKETKQALKLPMGIPSHAQLAPPATRKHILRYLMSTGQPTSAPKQRLQVLPSQPPPPPPPPMRRRVQRPLPGLPKLRQQQQQQKPDESLYYRGLQARAMQTCSQANHLTPAYGVRHWVATAHHPPMRTSQAPPLDVTNIISNFKSNALFRQQLAKHSHQQHLMNVAAYQMAPRQEQRLRTNEPKSKGHNTKLRLEAGELRKPYMRSLDSLHVKAAPNSSGFHLSSLSTLLNSVGNLLKGSSGSKVNK